MIPEQTRKALQAAINGEAYTDPGDPLPEQPQHTNEHEPQIGRHTAEVMGIPAYRWTAGCSCGWNGPYIWCEEEGARIEWLDHLVAMHVPNHWPAVVTSFEFEPEEGL